MYRISLFLGTVTAKLQIKEILTRPAGLICVWLRLKSRAFILLKMQMLYKIKLGWKVLILAIEIF